MPTPVSPEDEKISVFYISDAEFDELISQVKPLSTPHFLGKISPETGGVPQDTFFKRYETPVLSIPFDNELLHSVRVEYFATEPRHPNHRPRLSIVWYQANPNATRTTFSKDVIFPSGPSTHGPKAGNEARRLFDIVAKYKEVARSLPTEEAEALGFPQDFINELDSIRR